MNYAAREVILKDGRVCTLRSAQKQDAAEMLRYMVKMLDESPYLLSTSEEFAQMPLEAEERFIESALSNDRSVLVTAFDGDRIIGSAHLNPAGARQRVSHRCTMGITVLKEYWGVGLGSHIMQSIIDCAKACGYTQLELEVVTANRRALNLYIKFGFTVYGCHPNKVRYADGSYADDYLMYKML